MSEVIEARIVHPVKAPVPMVIPDAMVMDVMDVAPEKAEVPMARTVYPATLEGMLGVVESAAVYPVTVQVVPEIV